MEDASCLTRFAFKMTRLKAETAQLILVECIMYQADNDMMHSKNSEPNISIETLTQKVHRKVWEKFQI